MCMYMYIYIYICVCVRYRRTRKNICFAKLLVHGFRNHDNCMGKRIFVDGAQFSQLFRVIRGICFMLSIRLDRAHRAPGLRDPGQRGHRRPLPLRGLRRPGRDRQLEAWRICLPFIDENVSQAGVVSKAQGGRCGLQALSCRWPGRSNQRTGYQQHLRPSS